MTFTPVWGTEIAWYLFLAGLGAGAYAFSVFVQHFYPEAVKTRKFARFAAPIVVIITEIAWYLFLAGLGAGAYAFSVFVQHFYPEAVKTRKFARFAAPIVVIIGLILLMVDARAGFTHPLRFALLLHNPGSVMTWGVIFLAAFIVVSLVAALLEILKKPVWGWLNAVAVVLSFCVAGYTGVLLGVLNAFPLWNNGVLPVLFVVSAFSTGAALVMLGAQIFEPELAEGMVSSACTGASPWPRSCSWPPCSL